MRIDNRDGRRLCLRNRDRSGRCDARQKRPPNRSCMLVILVAGPRQLHFEFRSAAPGWQGATTENTRRYLREEQRRQAGCPARKPQCK